MKMAPVIFDVHDALTAWQWSPFTLFVLAGLVGAAYLYMLGDWRLSTRGRRWPAERTMAFMAGLVAVDLAFQSPVAVFAGSYFQAHVIQHLLLMVVAPPLLALSAPSTLFLQTANRKNKLRWLRVLRSRPFAVLHHPVIVWFLYFGSMFVFFLTSLINTAMQHMALMDLINMLFLAGGCMYWWPMVGVDPIIHWKMGYGARMFNLMIGIPPETILGLALLYQTKSVAPMYSVASSRAGGGLLWISTELATLIGLVPIFLQWLRSEERAAARADARFAKKTVVTTAVSPAGNYPDDRLSHQGKYALSAIRKDWSAARASAWEGMWLAKAGRLPSMTTSLSEATALDTSERSGN